MNAPTTAAPMIRPAQPSDVAAIAALLTDATTTDPVAAWLLPDPAERHATFHTLLAMDIDHAVESGTVDVTLDMSAVAVWHHHPTPHTPPLFRHHLNTTPDRALLRFQRLHALLGRYRSAAAHHWLAWLHVTPTARGHGIGQALLEHHHRFADRQGLPIDTVVTTTRTRDFLTRHGYHPGLPLHTPGSPRLWPLRRAGRPVPLTTAD